MINLNPQWLRGLGYDGLPEEHIESLLKTLYSELEERVGHRIAEGLTDKQMDEFSALQDGDGDMVIAWAKHENIDIATDKTFLAVKKQFGIEDVIPSEVLVHWAGQRWLELHRPNFRALVEEEFKALEKDLRKQAPTVMKNQSTTE